jgi:hypothetical protein
LSLEFAASIALGAGLLLLPLPLFVLWLIHGNNARYEWLIAGPPPFDQFGSGPFQLALVLGIWTLALGLLAIGGAIRRRVTVGRWTRGSMTLLSVAAPAAAFAFLGVSAMRAG